MALVASLCFASGNLIEKWAVDRMPPFSLGGMRQAVRAILRSRWWLVGAVVSVIGLPIQMIAYSRLAISIVQSISVAGIVVLVGVASLLYGERFGRREVTGLALAVGSLVLVSLSLTNGAGRAGATRLGRGSSRQHGLRPCLSSAWPCSHQPGRMAVVSSSACSPDCSMD